MKKKKKRKRRRRRREGGSAEDEKNAVCVHGSGGSDVCESRVRLAPVVVSVTSTGPGGGPRLLGPALLRSPSGPVPAEGPVWDAMPRLVLTVASDEGAPFCSLPLLFPPLLAPSSPPTSGLCLLSSLSARPLSSAPTPSYFPGCARRHDSRARVCVPRQARV